MNQGKRPIAIIGIGSPHGDDQFGWVVADELQIQHGLDVEKMNHPIDLIQSIDGPDRVIVIDAAFGLPEGDCFRSLSYANNADRALIQQIPSHGTHDMSVDVVLRMAESLGKRTDHIELWVGNAQSFERLSPMSSYLTVAAKRCADAIANEVCGARTIAG